MGGAGSATRPTGGGTVQRTVVVEALGPFKSSEKFARKQVLAKPYLANRVPINPKNHQSDQRLVSCSGRTTDEQNRRGALPLSLESADVQAHTSAEA